MCSALVRSLGLVTRIVECSTHNKWQNKSIFAILLYCNTAHGLSQPDFQWLVTNIETVRGTVDATQKNYIGVNGQQGGLSGGCHMLLL